MASDKLKQLTDAEFDDFISKGVTLVDFWAPWCGPCMAQSPILEQVAEKIGDAAEIAQVNVDENQQAAARFQVRSIPTILIFKDGQFKQQYVGMQQESALIEALEAAAE